MDAELDSRTLRRIIAILLAMAALAERAGSRSFPVRWLVLSILRSAEAVARDFIAGETQMAWPDLGDDLEPGSSRAYAALLGLRFRLLAAMLSALLPPAERPDIGIDRARLCLPPLVLVVVPRFGRPLPNDTS